MSLFGLQTFASRFRNEKSVSPLESALASATDAASIVVPDDVLREICDAAVVVENRRTIMQHLALCLNETQGSQWRRVYLAIVILEDLISNRDLVEEITEGVHFDLGQRMAFLEKFEYSVDVRVQNIVRQKAKSVHGAYRAAHEVHSELKPSAGFDVASQDASTADVDSCTDSSSGAEDTPHRRHEGSSKAISTHMAFDLLGVDDVCLPASGVSTGLHGAPAEPTLASGDVHTADLLDFSAASDTRCARKDDAAPLDDLFFTNSMAGTPCTTSEVVDLL